METQATNPISEVSPESLDELFSKDPLFLTKENIDTIVEALRAQRARWLVEEKAGGHKKAAKAATAEATKKLSLDNLEIEL